MSGRNVMHFDTDWLTNYFVESSELNDLARANGLKLVKKECSVCERTVMMPEGMDGFEGIVCIQCSDDAIHDYVERHGR